jgi:hypothetical protein
MQPASTGWLYTPPSSAAALSCPFNQFEVTRMLLYQGTAIAGIHEELALLREFLMGRQSQPPPLPQEPLLATTQAALPTPSAATTQAALPAPSWTTPNAVHLRGCAHPPRSLLALVVAASTVALGHPLVYSLPLPRTALPPLSWSATATHGGPRAPRVLYGGVNGTLFPSDVGATTGAAAASSRPPPRSEGASQAVPRFYKLEFLTYDDLNDPLNWLNHCEQFFSGQQTPSMNYTWLAAYHLHGAAQTWYFTLVQDEGQPTWERFKELCHLQFGPPVRGSRLAQLGRI